MANIIDYLKKYGNTSFEEESFNELDAAIFARLSYIDYASLINSRKYFSKKNLLKLSEEIIKLNDSSRFRLNEDNVLLQTVSTSTRYKNIYIRTYVKQTDQKKVKQFSAVSFINKSKRNNFILISFRGTDGTYTGWKEDFEMCYKPSIPSQDQAKKYALKTTRFAFKKKIILVGHSKGGNLAIYSSVFLNPKKIEAIYVFDSPGFNKSFLADKKYQAIKPLIKGYLPQTSIIGRLLYSDNESEIVDSNKSLLNQHNIYNWNINEVTFAKLSKFTYISNKINDVIKRNLESMTYEEKIEFVESLFSIIKEMTDNDVIQFEDSIFSFILRFNKILKTKSDETKRLIFSIFKKNKYEEEIKKVEPIKNKKSIVSSILGKFKKERREELPVIENEVEN